MHVHFTETGATLRARRQLHNAFRRVRRVSFVALRQTEVSASDGLRRSATVFLPGAAGKCEIRHIADYDTIERLDATHDG